VLCIKNPAAGGRWREVDEGSIHGPEHFDAAILDMVDALTTGRGLVLSARKALQATELIFAPLESSCRRQRVDLPPTGRGLDGKDSPLPSMLEEGVLTTADE
jgi:hypothetical protein